MIATIALAVAFVLLLALRSGLRALTRMEVAAVNGFHPCLGCEALIDPRIEPDEVLCSFCRLSLGVGR